MATDAKILELAQTQHGAFSRAQALARRVSDHALDHGTQAGNLERLHRGVYRVAGYPPSWHQRLMGACLAAGPGAAVSHRGAAFLHGLDGIDPMAEVVVADERRRRVNGVIVHRTRRFPLGDVESRDGIPCTRVARTIIDLAATVAPSSLERALDDALTRRLVSIPHIERRLAAISSRGREGSANLSRLLHERRDDRPRSQSGFERRLIAVLVAAGLPRPATQYPVALPGGTTAVLDAAYPDSKIAIEADSYRYHSSRRAWSHDRIRNRALTALGWLVLPVTEDDLSDRPRDVVAIVTQARQVRTIVPA